MLTRIRPNDHPRAQECRQECRQERRIVILALLFLASAAGGLVMLGAQDADAQTTPAKPAAAPQRPATAAQRPAAPAAKPNPDPAAAGVEAQPVLHARSAAVSACLPAISELSRLTLDGPYMAMSTWNKTDANNHMFSSIASLKYDNTIAPRAVALISASPNPNRACDGKTIQIQPSALSCDAIQKNISNPGLKAQDFNGLTLIQTEGPLRFLLMPTSGNGCTVVSMADYFAK